MALIILLLSPQPALAATITVSNSCSLANAITAANTNTATGGCPAGSGSDTIVVSGTVTLSAALPEITSNITITGGGTIDGNDTYRVLFANTGGRLTVNNMTITQGRATGADSGGGGIRAIGGATLTVINSTISESYSESNGGGISVQDNALSIVGSTISNNSTTRHGGGVNASFVNSVSIKDSVFTGNSASTTGNGGGAISIQMNTGRTATIERSAFVSNSANLSIIRTSSNLTIRNSTIHGNSSTQTSTAAAINFATNSAVTLTLSHVTIDGNTLVHALRAPVASPTVNVYNSILAGGSGNDCNVSGGIDSQAGNLIEDNSCSPAFSGDPLLPATTTGSPPYLLPATNSPAIGAANSARCARDDQRGVRRPQGTGCDIGAVERVLTTTAAFSYSSSGLSVNFNSSRSLGEGSLTYSWDFGDGSAASAEANPSHTYAVAGSYRVALTVNSAAGSAMRAITLTVPQVVEEEETEAVGEYVPAPTRVRAPVHSCQELDADQSGLSVWAQYGLTSGIQCQRRELDSVHVIQAPYIQSVINAGVQDAIEIWGFTGQSWEICYDNWRLGASGGLMFIEKKPGLEQVVHTAPGAYIKGSQTCIKLHDKAGYIVQVARATAQAMTLPTPLPNYRSLGADCMARTNYILNLRETPGGTIRRHIPAGVTLTAFERSGDWIKVDYHGERGWLSAGHVTEIGACG